MNGKWTEKVNAVQKASSILIKHRGNTLKIKFNEDTAEISGDTYDARNNIKNIWHGIYDGTKKIWVVEIATMRQWLCNEPCLYELLEAEAESKAQQRQIKSAAEKAMINLSKDGSLPSEREWMKDMYTETIAAEKVPFGRR